MTAKIKHIDIVALSFPVSHYISGWRPLTKTFHLVTFLLTDSGIVGIGEGTPYGSNVAETYMKALSLARVIRELSLKDALDSLISREYEEFKKGKHVNYGAFLALETAVLDALSKFLKKPIAEVLGGVYRGEVPVAGTVFLKHPLKMAEELVNWIGKGVEHVKFKTPCNLDDLEFQLKVFRDKLQSVGAENVVLRADANECFDRLKKARRALEIMER